VFGAACRATQHEVRVDLDDGQRVRPRRRHVVTTDGLSMRKPLLLTQSACPR
jgi:hypothetical protein